MQVNIKIINISGDLDQFPDISKASTITYEPKSINIGCKHIFI